MLILTRRPGERIIIETADGPIEVMPIEVSGTQVKLGVQAPRHVIVHREEIRDRIEAEKSARTVPCQNLKK